MRLRFLAAGALLLLAQRPAAFVDASASTGLVFQHFNGATGRFYMPEIVGPGAGLIDYDNDGDLDVVLVQGDFLVPPRPGETAKFPLPANHPKGSRLFRNDLIPSGKLHFTDVTDAARLLHRGFGMGVAAGDIDNDGDLDLYITAYGPNHLYRNDGGKFVDITASSGTGDNRWSTSAVFFDYDRDGWQDLFVTTYVDFNASLAKICKSGAGELDYCGPAAFEGQTSTLYRNLGGGKFKDVSRETGIAAMRGPGLGVIANDLDGDLWPDLYVANDGKANHLWKNRNGRFTESGIALGVALADSGEPRAGMGIAAGDLDGDGRAEVLVTNLTNEGATLFSNAGGKGFFDVSLEKGVNLTTRKFTGFGVGWFDASNTGLYDLFIANGAVKVEEAMRGSKSRYPYGQRNQLLRRDAAGKWVDIGAQSGGVFGLEEVSRSAAFGDVDNDGDMDIVVANNNGPVRLLLNQNANHNHWLLAAVDGGPRNRFGTGTRLEIRRNGKPALWRAVQIAYSYLASNDSRVHIGLGEDTTAVNIVAHWPDGVRELFPMPGLNRIVRITRGQGQPQK